MKLPTITGFVGIKDDRDGKITLIFESHDGRSHYLPMQVGVLNAMLGPVVAAAKAHQSATGKHVDIQPLTLTGARMGVDPLGNPMIQLELDHIPLHVALPRSAIPVLQNALRELQSLTDEKSSGQKH